MLAAKITNTLEFCHTVEVLQDASTRHGRPGIINTYQVKVAILLIKSSYRLSKKTSVDRAWMAEESVTSMGIFLQEFGMILD